MPARPIRVLMVDDSAVVRKILNENLANDPEIEVVGAAIERHANEVASTGVGIQPEKFTPRTKLRPTVAADVGRRTFIIASSIRPSRRRPCSAKYPGQEFLPRRPARAGTARAQSFSFNSPTSNASASWTLE